MILTVLTDGFFAAIAAIGFGAISCPPRRAFLYIALLAAIGHALRFLLLYLGGDLATSSFIASFFIGLGSLWLGSLIFCPMTTLYIPALLPMIPGMYAYKTVFALIMFLQHLNDSILSQQYMQELFLNALVTCSVLFALAVGATIPIFIFSKKAYSLTRHSYEDQF